jgi:hypothetical protein
VSNKQGNLFGSSIANGGVGYCCLAEVRMYETIEHGAPKTAYLKFGDTVRIEMRDAAAPASSAHRADRGTHYKRAWLMKLYTYFRSSAAYRVRIALNLKGHRLRCVPVHLLRTAASSCCRPTAPSIPRRWCRRWTMTAPS